MKKTLSKAVTARKFESGDKRKEIDKIPREELDDIHYDLQVPRENDNTDVDIDGSGFSNVMAKILGQSVGGKKVPVLAKRKTSVMREIETERENREQMKKLRSSRKAERDKQMLVPSVLQNDYERQLKKVGTRGGNVHSTLVWLLFKRTPNITYTRCPSYCSIQCYHEIETKRRRRGEQLNP